MDLLLALAVAVPGTLLGSWLGMVVYRRLDDRRFDRIVLHRAARCRGSGWSGRAAELAPYFRCLRRQEPPIRARECSAHVEDVRLVGDRCRAERKRPRPVVRGRAGTRRRKRRRRRRRRPRQEKKEREVRKQCAVALCSTLHNKKPAEGQVTCNIQKSWRKEALTKILARGKVSWPWGDARCASELKFDRAMLIKAMQEADFEAQLDTYDIRCQIDNDKDKYDVITQVRPKVTFKQGKAVKANLNWGKIEAPTLGQERAVVDHGGRQHVRAAAEHRGRGHQRLHRHQVHGVQGRVAGQIASSRAGPCPAGSARQGHRGVALPLSSIVEAEGRRAMSTTMLLLLSGVLIGAGVSLIWLDVYKRQRGTFVIARDRKAGSEAEPEITRSPVFPPGAEPALQARRGRGGGSGIGAGGDAAPRRCPPVGDRPAMGHAAARDHRGSRAGQHGACRRRRRDRPPGEPSFSIDKAYGAPRRILVGGESVGWLRLQCTPEGTLKAAVKAHKDELAEINAEASARAAGVNTVRASDLLSECLKPCAAYAMRTGGGDAEQRASERAWKAVDTLVIGALEGRQRRAGASRRPPVAADDAGMGPGAAGITA